VNVIGGYLIVCQHTGSGAECTSFVRHAPLPPVCVQEDICATALDDADLTVGSSSESDLHVAHDSVQSCHARVSYKNGRYYVACESSSALVWLNGRSVEQSAPQQIHPGDLLTVGSQQGEGLTFKVKQLHRSQRKSGLLSATPQGIPQRYAVNFPHLPQGKH
jgi:FHA domain